MEHLLLVCEKRMQARMAASALYQHGVIGDETRIDIICVMPMSWWHYKIPSHIPMASIPHTTVPGFTDLAPFPFSRGYGPVEKPGSFSQFDALVSARHRADDQGDYLECSLAECPDPQRQSDPIKAVAERLDTYDQIIIFPDSDHSGWSSAYRWMDKLDAYLQTTGKADSIRAPHRDLRAIWMTGMDSESMFKSYEANTPLDDPRIQRARRFGEAKRVFDYWWFYNSAAVFSKAQQLAGVENLRFVSKYMLMTLHLLGQWGKPVNWGVLLRGMECWAGTGKYITTDFYKRCVPVHSFAAMCYRPDEGQAHVKTDPQGVWAEIGSRS